MMALKGAYLSNGFLDEASCALVLALVRHLATTSQPPPTHRPRLIVAQDKMVMYMSSDHAIASV
jgi:hypothetical protein